MGEVIPLRVAVRVRPLIPKEQNEGCQVCVNFVPGEPQLFLGKDRSFTYDHVFSINDPQSMVYEEAVQDLIVHIFRGYNATVLAYGQTGSGKTYTMGGGYAESLKMDPVSMGIIPRIVKDIFDKIEAQSADYESIVHVSYLEIINEDLQDLLTSGKASLAIREDNGQIKIPGLKEQLVAGAGDTMQWLESGGQHRTTAATAMNSTSSRSHAIFTISIEHRNKEDVNDFWCAKLQLVDLAGSERIKKTHAEGERLKEGININKGLLSLGNVISALGDEAQKKAHIPYRDSKLTRILQDSLGGNSHTLMIACVSPADSNMEETLNTLRYADRARKIKNKPIVNWDPQTAKIMQLQEIIQQLNLRLIQAGVTDVTSSISSSSTVTTEAQVKSNTEELRKLKDTIKTLQEDNDSLTHQLTVSMDQHEKACEKNVRLEMKLERLQKRLESFTNLGLDFDVLSSSMSAGDSSVLGEQLDKLKTMAASVKQLKEEDGTEEVLTEEEDEDEEQTEGGDMLGGLDTPESRQMAKQHVLRRVRLNSELQELNAILEKKERLASQMASKEESQTLADKEQLESKVKQLEDEKENLVTALQDAKSHNAAGKLSEQRRKRLQELETQQSDLKRQLTEHKKKLKLQESTNAKVTKLNSEIQGMKTARVRLMKQMKEDSDNFRKWKQQKDRELLQLQQKDRKRQFEIQKLQRENQKTQNVLQRKSQEATAANRRLKEALAKQKAVLEDRSQKFDKMDKASVGNRIKRILSQEVEVKVSTLEAKYHRQRLLEDRKTLTEQLNTLREQLSDDGPPAKKLAWMDDSGRKCETSFQEEEAKDKMKQLKEQIVIRNVQISDLQQKLFDADQESKGKEAKDSIHTMMEAKIAVKWLLEQAVSFKAHNDRLNGQLEEEKEKIDTTGQEQGQLVENLESELTRLKNTHDKQVLNLEKQHQKEIQLMRKTSGSSPDLQYKATLQEEEIKKLKKELASMEKHMTKYMYKDKSIALMPELTDDEGNKSPFLTPRPKPKVLQQLNNITSTGALEPGAADGDDDEDIDDDNFDDEDDDFDDTDSKENSPAGKVGEVDPDWVRTPMLREVQRRTKKKRRRTDLFEQPQPKGKRVSDRGCGCTTNCRTKRCLCHKNMSFCSDYCRCKGCQNKEKQEPESTTSEKLFPALSNSLTEADEEEASSTSIQLDATT